MTGITASVNFGTITLSPPSQPVDLESLWGGRVPKNVTAAAVAKRLSRNQNLLEEIFDFGLQDTYETLEALMGIYEVTVRKPNKSYHPDMEPMFPEFEPDEFTEETVEIEDYL